MLIDDALKALAKIFLPNTLYIVGGCVRNALMATTPTDIDLCGALTPDEVFVLGGSHKELKIIPVNPRIGTLKLIFRGQQYEYTAFRRDNYDIGGAHRPEEVVFTRRIDDDAKRRDFTVNAVYYDIVNQKTVDPLGGIGDIVKKTLKTCAKPEKTLSEDGLRLMRLVRFAAEYGFSIDEETFSAAKKYAALLEKISPERKRLELVGILNADNISPESGMRGVERGLNLLCEIGLLKYIIPELEDCVGFNQSAKYHKYDVFTHIIKTTAYAPKRIRLAALFHDIGKPQCFKENGNMYRHSDYGVETAKIRLGANGLRFSKDEINRALKLICHHMYDIDGRAAEKKVRIFIQENAEIIPDLLELKKADYAAKGFDDGVCQSALKLERIFNEMRERGIPTSVSELKINGGDVRALGFLKEEIGSVLRHVLYASADAPRMLTREAQLAAARSMKKRI
ncbi:MAG: CCA tRNA nucleotidyltransferase [Clostridiales bacterium]|jgi:tRNA nucleotidyltransferase (CCA-adding enzyme)|nr:CCA tRNA nucleotidyltransferase [Clostridiales bacterium]